MTPTTWSDAELKARTVADLRELCADNNLAVSGRKADLIKRLSELSQRRSNSKPLPARRINMAPIPVEHKRRQSPRRKQKFDTITSTTSKASAAQSMIDDIADSTTTPTIATPAKAEITSAPQTLSSPTHSKRREKLDVNEVSASNSLTHSELKTSNINESKKKSAEKLSSSSQLDDVPKPLKDITSNNEVNNDTEIVAASSSEENKDNNTSPSLTPRREAKQKTAEKSLSPTIQEEQCSQVLKIALVCHSNLNRSMEAHSRCTKAGLEVSSYGAGSRVNLPGLTRTTPNIYEFNTPYQTIYDDLYKQDPDVYEKNGVFSMLRRNIGVKKYPEKWQCDDSHFDLIVCFEQRIFDLVAADISQRSPGQCRVCHVVNIETVDNLTAAVEGGQLSLELVQKLNEHADWEERIDDALDELDEKTSLILHSVMFY